MTELITHEIEISVAACSHGRQTDHLMQGHSSVDDIRLGILVHREIHFLVHQTESDGLVSNHCLIVALRIADGLFVRTFVGKLPPHLSHAPLVIREFLDPFYPVIRHTHAHSKIEADTSRLNRSCQSGHAADIFCDGKGFRIHLPDEDVGESKIGHGIFIHTLVEVIVIADKILLQTMIPVKHAGHAIKSETVDMVLLHPVLAIGQKEVFGLVLSIIEATRTPCRMSSLPAVIEIQRLLSVEQAKSFSLIVYRMRMNDIHHHGYAPGMSIVNKSLELLRGAES